jgi:predicted SAM-dependent methyltransferase
MKMALSTASELASHYNKKITRMSQSPSGSLREQLLHSLKTRWLDVGCGGNFEEGFFYADIFPEGLIDPQFRSRYYRLDILCAPADEFTNLGQFDLVRMQHTFEHFSYEEGQHVLSNCARLVRPGGLILITVPDLRIHLQRYFRGEYGMDDGFTQWATRRIPHDAPPSFYFSIFAHSMPYESHKWCYDSEGLCWQLKTNGAYFNIVQIGRDSMLASKPFTHNRPDEDLCVIATRR